MGTQTVAENEFNVIQFEKRLTSLKDSQDNINACCKWCLENRQHHKKIVTSWLNVLKRVKIEQRVNLFYLANDVIQYSKRRNYEYVESWGTALQKATTLVRDDKVKHKILRIFAIWEQRGVYNDEFISDLCGLISVVPTASKNDEPHEFQASYVVNKIKHCSKLENETDLKLKVLKEHNPKIQIETESLCVSLKDRAHVDDVEKELEIYVKHLEGYINALKAEIKCRINNISVLRQASVQLDKDKKDVKVVANAYRTFGTRVKAFQRKLNEHRVTLISPVPSPDVNAPSPSPDSDLDLPDEDNETKSSGAADYNNTIVQYTNAGYYNPVPPPSVDSGSGTFVTNGYTSFMGSNNPFNIQNLNTSSLFTNTQSTTEVTDSGYNLTSQPPPPPVEGTTDSGNFQYQTGHLPLLPPPMPPFSTKNDYDGNYNNTPYGADDKSSYANTPYNSSTLPYQSSEQDYNNPSIYEVPPPTVPTTTSQQQQQQHSNSSSIVDYVGAASTSYDTSTGVGNVYPPPPGTIVDEYNPEQEPDTWEADASWSQPPLDTDTPESPPLFEKESYNEPIEYHDNINASGASDVDHRVLHTISTDLVKNVRGRGKDVDHRNLISLTGSPGDSSTELHSNDVWSQQGDQDYRNQSISSVDQDYRLTPFNIEQLKLPPPPPPPSKPLLLLSSTSPQKKLLSSPRKLQDNVESIDMDMSEDENDSSSNNNDNHLLEANRENLKIVVDNSSQLLHGSSLEPPPPFPDLPDDVDANSFLDDLSNDLNSNEFTANLPENVPDNMLRQQQQHQHENFSSGPPPPPNFQHLTNVPPPPLMNNWLQKQQSFGVYRGGGVGNGGRGNSRGYRGGNNANGRSWMGGRGNYRSGFRPRGFRNGGNRAVRARGNNNRGNYQGGF